MILVEDYKLVLRKAWSMKFIFATAVFSAMEVALPFFVPLDILPPRTMAVLALFASFGAAVSRVVAQPKTLP